MKNLYFSLLAFLVLACADEDPSSLKSIISFDISTPSVTGVISETDGTISLVVPEGTSVTALTPTIVVSENARVSPASGTTVNFTNPVKYTVTAEDGGTQTYTVTVVSPDKQINSFKFEALSPAVVGTINQSNRTIILKVRYQTDVTSLIPTIVIAGKSISPASGIAQDFTTPVTYTVTASDGSTQTYTASVEVLPINVATINWTARLRRPIIYSLAASGKNVYMGCDAGVFRTSDNGSTWTNVTEGTGIFFVNTVTISGNNIYVGTTGAIAPIVTNGGVYLSTDNGNSWSSLLSVPERIYSIAVKGSNIFAASVGGGIYLSTNNGADWVQANNGINNNALNMNSVVVSGNNVIATDPNFGGSFLSNDNGTSWTSIGLPIIRLVASGNDLFASTSTGLYLSTDHGVNWTIVNTGLSTMVFPIFSYKNYLFARGEGGKDIFLSANRGGSWTSISTDLLDESISSVVINGSTIYVATFLTVFSSPL
jgi:Domain of unknown function (DUF5018)/Domain of unknown function (DUF6242)